jgi:glutamyl endopeptidase
VSGWPQSKDEQFDYGAIKLNCTVGNTTGWFGYWWQAATLTGLPQNVSGYPGDKPLTQWRHAGSISVTLTRQLFYLNDTAPGQSGAPVFQNRGAGSSFCVGQCTMAIHTYGPHGGAPHSQYNHATRIVQAVYNNLVTWKNTP